MNWLPGPRGEESLPGWSEPVASSFECCVPPEGVQRRDSDTQATFATPDMQSLMHEQSNELACQQVPAIHTAPGWPYALFESSITNIPPGPPPQKRRERRCYAHGCNGRSFSSLGNYRRHLKEQNGYAKRFSCETCGKVFTRSTAKNEHQKTHQKSPVMPDPTATPPSLLELEMASIPFPNTGNASLLPCASEYIYPHQWPQQTQTPPVCELDWSLDSNHVGPRHVTATDTSSYCILGSILDDCRLTTLHPESQGHGCSRALG